MNPANYNTFPSVAYYIRNHAISKHFTVEEAWRIEQIIAEHEMGTIPERYVQILRQLKQTHRLGIISDIWSRSDIYFRELRRLCVDGLFETIVFSSDIGVIKPSPVIFEKAVRLFDVDLSKIVYIGDSFRRDVVGGKKIWYFCHMD
jgi:FMN phosphatase YigB (HAD superfamily)